MKLKHLLQIEDLDALQLEQLIQQGQQFTQLVPSAWGRLQQHGLTLVNLFYENSTRTRISFELAAKRLGITVINVDIQTSSIQKGETVMDTVANLAAMQCYFFVIRHRQEYLPQSVAQQLTTGSVINAGDGCHEHPTQALLDMLTIYQHKKQFKPLSVGIIGDIAHSRVANSQIAALKLLGCRDIRLIAPSYFLPAHHQDLQRTELLSHGLAALDVIITLRVQQERIEQLSDATMQYYRDHYCLTAAALSLAKPDAIVMHPGPINREIEISSDVADSAQSMILQQVRNSVPMRMAVLECLTG